MNEPIRKIAMHWGTRSLISHSPYDEDANTYQFEDVPYVTGLFKGPASAAAWRNGNAHSVDLNDVYERRMAKIFNRLVNPQTGRGLLVAVLDGRFVSGFGDEINQPCFRAGGPSDPRQVLAHLVRAVKVHKSHVPVDVFMLTAIRPDFIDLYAQELPKGSIITAIKTPNHTNSSWFSHLDANLTMPDGVKDGRKRWAYTPGAPDILVDYIMSGAAMVGAPYVAVSGHRALPLYQAWKEIVKRPSIDEWKAKQTDLRLLAAPLKEMKAAFFAQEEPHTVARLDWLAQQRGYNRYYVTHARDCRSECEKSPLHKFNYAYAALELSAKVFGPQHSWALLDEARAGERRASPFAPAPIPTGYQLAANVPVSVQTVTTGALVAERQAKGTRLTSAELAGLPPNLRKLAHAAPQVVKRLLRS